MKNNFLNRIEKGDFTFMYNQELHDPLTDIARHAMTHTSLRDASRMSSRVALL